MPLSLNNLKPDVLLCGTKVKLVNLGPGVPLNENIVGTVVGLSSIHPESYFYIVKIDTPHCKTKLFPWECLSITEYCLEVVNDG